MKTKLTTEELMRLCRELTATEFGTWENIYPNGYELDDLFQELLCAYYQKVFPRLNELDKAATANGHKLITYVRQKLSTQLYDIRRRYRAQYKQLLNMTLETVDWIAETEESDEGLETKKYLRPLMAQQPQQADDAVSEKDDIDSFRETLDEMDTRIFDLIRYGNTEREIAELVGISQQAVHKRIAKMQIKAKEEIQ